MDLEFIELKANKQSIVKRKLVHSKGINNAPYVTTPKIGNKQAMCPYFSIWRQSLVDFKHSLPETWLLFTNFKDWMHTQDWKGKKLVLTLRRDKNNFIFITKELNRPLTNRLVHGLEYTQAAGYELRIMLNKIFFHQSFHQSSTIALETLNAIKTEISKEVDLSPPPVKQIKPLTFKEVIPFFEANHNLDLIDFLQKLNVNKLDPTINKQIEQIIQIKRIVNN